MEQVSAKLFPEKHSSLCGFGGGFLYTVYGCIGAGRAIAVACNSFIYSTECVWAA